MVVNNNMIIFNAIDKCCYKILAQPSDLNLVSTMYKHEQPREEVTPT